MAFSCVQTKSASGSGTSLGITFNSSTGTGVLICVGAGVFATATLSFSDNKSGSYTVRQTSNASSGSRCSCGEAQNVSGGATHTVTTTSTASGTIAAAIAEYTGAATASAQDVGVANREASTSSPTSGNTAATAEDSELVFGTQYCPATTVNYTAAGGTASSGTPTTTLVKRQEVDTGGGETLAIYDKLTTTVGSTTSISSTSSMQDHYSLCQTYKNAAAGAATAGATNRIMIPNIRGVPMVGGRMMLTRNWGSAGGTGIGYGNRRRRVICS